MRRPVIRAVERFVGADIERADHHRLALQSFGHRLVRFVLLILAGQVFSIHEQEFAAKQPDAGRAGMFDSIEIGRQFNVGVQLNSLAVQCFS